MKRILLSALAACTALLCSISCNKQAPFEALDPTLPDVEEGTVNIHPAEITTVKILLNDVRGCKVTAKVTSENENFATEAAMSDNCEICIVSVTAPIFIYKEQPFKVTVQFTEEANSRTAETSFTVKPIDTEFIVCEEAANCFQVPTNSIVLFPTQKGNTEEKVAFKTIELLWQDNPGLFDQIWYSDAAEGTAIVGFGDEKEGNAVLAAKDASGKVLWSWHFWVCADEIKDVVVGGVTFMDRNIGATIAQPKYEGKIITATTGLIYQWGRKDPFAPAETLDGFRTIYDKDGKEITFTDKDGKEATAKIAACEVADNIQNAIENPDTWYNNVYPVSQGNYSWITNNVETVDKDKVAKLWDNNGAKTEYDPCPAGYKVAAQSDWAAAIGTAEAPTAYTEIFDDKYAPAQEVLDKWKSQSQGKYYDQYLKQSQFRGAKLGDMYVIGSGEVAHQHTISNTFGGSSQNVVSTIWSGTADPNIGTATAKSATYFRAYAVKLSYSYSSNKASFNAKNAINFAYGQPVRCVKVAK